jgi:ribosomal protein L40E
MRVTGLKQSEVLVCRNCDRCGAKARLFGIESHPTVERAELRTYVCGRCDAMQTEVLPLP